MKKVTLALGLMLAYVGMARAYEVQGNPDRKISFGFNYDRSKQNSEYTFMNSKITDFAKMTGDSFTLDTRVPLSEYFTFNVHGGFGYSDNDLFTGEKVSYSGYDIGAGLRLYLP